MASAILVSVVRMVSSSASCFSRVSRSISVSCCGAPVSRSGTVRVVSGSFVWISSAIFWFGCNCSDDSLIGGCWSSLKL